MKNINPKALLVISFLLSFFISLAQNDDDCKLLNNIITANKFVYKESFLKEDKDRNINLDSLFTKNFVLSKYNNNDDIDHYFEQLKEREQMGRFMHLDSLRKQINDTNYLFSDKNKEFFCTQITEKKSLWSQTLCKPDILTKERNPWNLDQSILFVSKPIYTADKRYAIVFIGIHSLYIVNIFYNEPKTGWKEIDWDIIAIS